MNLSMPAPKRGPKVRYDSDRTHIVTRVHTTFARLTRPGHTPHDVREIIKREIRDGLKGTAYDTDQVSGGGTDTTPVERIALSRTDTGHDDLTAFDRALELAQEAEAILHDILDRRDPVHHRKAGDTDTKRRPGKGTAPKHRCRACWMYGVEEHTDDRYRDFCRWCGDWDATHGARPPRELWRIHQQGKRVTTADIRRHAPHLLKEAVSSP